jgi:creatinine amidohydrolase
MNRLADMTWPAAEARRTGGALLVVPLASTEQHGPHLPLSTDTDIAVALAERLVAARADAVVAPAVAYGASGEHSGFAGTVSIGQEAVELLLVELVRSASLTFERTVIVSAHGGNAAPLARAASRLAEEGRSVLTWAPRWRGDAHAGRTETSVMLALHPGRVALERAAAGNVTPLRDLYEALRAGGVRPVAGNGVLGDPGGASADEGRRLMDAAAADLIETVRQWIPARDS